MSMKIMPSYRKFAEAGHITFEEADTLDAAREHGRVQARDIPIGDHEANCDTVFMGVLDVSAARLSRMLGGEVAALIFESMAAACRRNADLVESLRKGDGRG